MQYCQENPIDAYCAVGWGQWWHESTIFWSSAKLALFDEESWQSSNWPWSCLSDRVMSLFWATLRSLLTGSHQKSSQSSQAWNLSRMHILSPSVMSGGISLAQNPTWSDQRDFSECAWKISTHFQPPCLKCSQWKVSQCNRVESKRFRVRVENSQICLCGGSKPCDRGSA